MYEPMVSYTLPFPPSVNTYYRRGARSTYMSKQGIAFKKAVAEIVCADPQKIEGRLSVFISLSSPSRRKFDIDNRIKACLDALQDAGVFDDDEQIDRLGVCRLDVDKPGFCKVVIVNT